jgi:nucleotide-binding universal stress UspA family protein
MAQGRSMGSFVWVVGVDLTAHCHGALRFADWLHRRTRALGHRFDALHVIERMRMSTLYPGSGPVLQRAIRLTRANVLAVGARHAIRSIDVARADLAAEELGARATEDGAGLLIGRAGANEGWSPVALGGTTRLLLRSLPGPVCIVPPDLDVARLDPGPLLVSLEIDESSIAALRFAFGLGRQIGRPVIGVHGGDDGDDARARIEKWCDEHDLPVPGLRLGAASTTAAAVNDAESERACMIICGATRLTLADRSLYETAGTRLAALASCPVLVIPPGEGSARRRSVTPGLEQRVDSVPQQGGPPPS